MIKLLHFADAHIDMAQGGRHDPESGLPVRVMDFLKSLDQIVDTAIAEKADLVIFSGDAYKDRAPQPTYQREWGRRMMRLSHAGIPTLLLTGNHDISPSASRAHALQEIDTLEVPHVHVINKPSFLGPEQLEGLGVQVIALPWVTRSGLMAAQDVSVENPLEALEELEKGLSRYLQSCLMDLDPELPTILAAHASIEGAKYGNERTVMLGRDLVLPLGLVRDERLDYVALGHIHKAQNLNEGMHPPVVYPGSIERVDFGEAQDEKFFVMAEVEKGRTKVQWRKLTGIRKFIDLALELEGEQDVNKRLQSVLPEAEALRDAIVRLIVSYPRELETLIDEASLRAMAEGAFEFHFVKRPHQALRMRLPGDREMSSYTPGELLEAYWQSLNIAPETRKELEALSKQIIDSVESGEGSA